jgi:PAS domain S-box-containing protein
MSQTELERKYRIVLDISPTPLMVVGNDGRILLANNHIESLFGYEAGGLVGSDIDILVPDQIKHIHPELRRAFFELPTTRSMGKGRDLFGKHRDGRLIPVEIGLQPVIENDETMVVVSVVDITERKNNETRIRLTLDAAASAMIKIDDHGRIVLTNASADAMFGYAKDELIGRSIEDLVPERFRRRHSVYRTSYLISRERRAMGAGRELYGLRKNGGEFPIEIGLTPFEDARSRLVVATIIDITERKAREDLIREKNAELTQLNEELTQFAYSASHDLKAPLASITGALKLCQQDIAAGNAADADKLLSRTQRMSERLAQRIEDMLSLARADHVEDVVGPVSVAEAVGDVWTSLGGPDRGDKVNFTTRYGHQDPIVTVKVRFFVILENLLSNALKYRDPKKARSEIAVETHVAGGSFILSVRDNGIGIPEDCRDKVFKLFQRFSNSKDQGSGLGLALVQKHVRCLGGAITFKSTPAGTVFTVALPDKPSAAVQDAAE